MSQHVDPPVLSINLFWKEVWWRAFTQLSVTIYERFANGLNATSRKAYDWVFLKLFSPRLWRIYLVSGLGLGLALAIVTGLQAYAQSLAPAGIVTQASLGNPNATRPQSISSSGIITAQGNYLIRNGNRFEVRGMNYYSKDYAWDKFWTTYTTTVTSTNQITTELNLAQALGVNTVRVFLPYNLFSSTNQIYLSYLKNFINHQLQSRNMVAIITLFDFYPSQSNNPYLLPADYISSTDHISAVINTLGITNSNVLAWDLKDELDRDYESHDTYQSPGKDKVMAWAKEMISYTRQLDPNHLITIGFYGAIPFTGTLPCDSSATLVYSPTIAAEFSSTVDFASIHYFLSERCYEDDVQALQMQIGNKPVILEEFGLHTMTNVTDTHNEIQQAAYYNALLSLSEAHSVAGYLFWTLNDFSYIPTGFQQTHHCQGILRNSLVSTCQFTTTTDYSEKPAADIVRRHYDNRVAYLDLFDSWVATDTDKPPAGWSDNWEVGGGVTLRGYHPSNDPFYRFWSKDQGKVAFSKFEPMTTSITGTATSPMLVNINIDDAPILAGQVYSYSVRDFQSPYAGDASLYIGVKEGSQITPLLAITPGISLPYNFLLNLHQPPTSWSGTHNFQIIFELIPQALGNGYSASYELDWIGVGGTVIYLPIIMKNYPPPP